MRTHNVHRLRQVKPHASPALSRAVLGVAIVEPLMTAPQVWQIWSTHNTAGVSLLTWAFYLAGATVWLFYGLKMRDKPIIISSAIWAVMEAAVILGLVAFK